MGRYQHIRSLYPNRPVTEVLPRLFDDHRVSLADPYILRVAYFRGAKPAQLAHFDWLADYASEPMVHRDGSFIHGKGGYYLVSAAWKSAIESLEPNTHQFFPCELKFSDVTLHGHFVFRPMQILDFVDRAASDPGTAVVKLGSGPSAGQYAVRAGPRGLAGKRDIVAGRHWVKYDWMAFPAISRALAERLRHLLPPHNVELAPIRLV